MEEPTRQSIQSVTGHIARLSDEEADQLLSLLSGVKAAADRMEALQALFPGYIDASAFSQTVEGDDA